MLNAQQLEWCERRLLARIHRYTLDRLRREIEPVTAADYLRFLFSWQHVTEESHLEGPAGVRQAILQLQGCDIAAAAWEGDVLPLRVRQYDHRWIDELTLSGAIVWGRRLPAPIDVETGRRSAQVRQTSVGLFLRENLHAWLKLAPCRTRHWKLSISEGCVTITHG
ncbi:MAG TPA: hypothetical protein VGP72_10255 [Planctomycetota bacterium]